MNAAPLPAAWPVGKRLAVSVNIMCEAWTDDAAPGIGPMGNPLNAGVLDTQARSWAEYGMTIGAYRPLDIVAESGVPCGTYASGIIAEKWPELLKRIDSDGHFVGAHAWMQNTLPAYQERDAEAADLKRGADLFGGVIGSPPAVIDITAHAHVFGRPFGAIEIKAAIDLVKDIDWVWMTTHEELAARFVRSEATTSNPLLGERVASCSEPGEGKYLFQFTAICPLTPTPLPQGEGLLNTPSAVDLQAHAGDQFGRVGGQEYHAGGDIGRGRQPAQRYRRSEGLAAFRRVFT